MEKPGSTTRDGYLYHEPAFPVNGKKLHRSDNRERLDLLRISEDWWHKEVLDLGCNVGYFTIRLALEGARVTGIDTDKDALRLGREQADKHRVEGTFFMEPNPERRYTKDKDVLLALSVLPWIHATDPDPEAALNHLFSAPTAYVEIPYPPDGRAHVPGVVDDATAQKYLSIWYPSVVKIATSNDNTDGVVRQRSIFKCTRPAEPKPVIGSQSIVGITDNLVCKARREGKTYDPVREATFLERLAKYDIAPKVQCPVSDGVLTINRIKGYPITSASARIEDMPEQLQRIGRALSEEGISHNDIRPANLIVGADKKVYLIDFGHATWAHERKPSGVNPVYGALDDHLSLDKVLESYKTWGL